MKICIAVGGKFHAFYLAAYLQEKGHLHQLVTSYPTFEVVKHGIPSQKVCSVLSKEIIERTWKKLTGNYPSLILLCDWFDFWASRQIKLDADVYIIWSSFALKTVAHIRKHNPKAKIIIERGSAHIETQAELLKKIANQDVVQPEIVAKEKAEYAQADFVSTISLFAKNTFLEKGFQTDKIFVNNMGVDLQEFPFYDRKIKTAAETFVVGYVGVMSSQKNAQGLIEAVALLNHKGLKIKLLLIGGIDTTTFDKTELEQNFIDYKGIIPQNQLHIYYSQMDLFVLNSVQDGFGLVILQAMSTGLAVIGTTNTGTPDVVTDFEQGFVIPIEDNVKLAEKVQYCYENREKNKQMGILARKRVEKGFSWQDYSQRYLERLEMIKNSIVLQN